MQTTFEEQHRAVALLRSPGGEERRGEARHPVFKPVEIQIGDERVEGFTSDISMSGIGLTHREPTGTGLAIVTFSADEDGVTHDVEMPVEILWTRQCRSGWYISGGCLL